MDEIIANEIIAKLKEKLKKNQEYSDSEANLKYHITSWVLKELGYDKSKFDYEHPLCRQGKDMHADIYIPITENVGMLVETKKLSKDLQEDDVRQLIQYINIKNILWGMLTNGRQYYLINNDIRLSDGNENMSDIMCRVVLCINIAYGKKSGKNEKYFKYLSKENLFERRVTNFYKDIAQFFALNPLKPNSQGRYINTLYNFFNDYADKIPRYNVTSIYKTMALDEITVNDVLDFFYTDRPYGRPYTGKMPKEKCSHISTMFKVLKKAGYIQENRLKNLRERAAQEFDIELSRTDTSHLLTIDNVEFITKKLEEKDNAKTPYKLLTFILCAYYGFDSSSIVEFYNLSWEKIDFKKHTFDMENGTYPMVKKLEDVLQIIKKGYASKKIKAKSIYVIKNGRKYESVTEAPKYTLFDETIKKFTKEDVDWKVFTAQRTRASAIINMFEGGLTLEEISFLTGSSVGQLLRYIPNDKIREVGEKRWKDKRKGHPFAKIFD